MTESFALSAEDRRKLQKLLSEHGISPGSPQEESPIHTAPEFYVGKPHADSITGAVDGIPALQPGGSDSYDHPGCGLCDIYQITSSTASGHDWDLVPISNFTQPVYNITGLGIGNDWILVIRNKAGHWIAVDQCYLVAFQLTEPLQPLGEAAAEIFYQPDDCAASGSGSTPGAVAITVRDVINVMAVQIDPSSSSASPRTSASTSSCGWAQRTDEKDIAGLRIYDIVSIGGVCCPTSSNSSSSTSGSNKSTAIVPASWSQRGYTALFVAECPEVRFDDVLPVEMPQVDADLRIDPRFIEVCEIGSVQVCGCISDRPAAIGAIVEAGKVRIRFSEQLSKVTIRLVIRLTGVRRGFLGRRFPERSQAQFDANERFIRSAYPEE